MLRTASATPVTHLWADDPYWGMGRVGGEAFSREHCAGKIQSGIADQIRRSYGRFAKADQEWYGYFRLKGFSETQEEA